MRTCVCVCVCVCVFAQVKPLRGPLAQPPQVPQSWCSYTGLCLDTHLQASAYTVQGWVTTQAHTQRMHLLRSFV